MLRYDLASPYEPRVILITDLLGKRSDVPRLGYVVIPNRTKNSRADDARADRALHKLATALGVTP